MNNTAEDTDLRGAQWRRWIEKRGRQLLLFARQVTRSPEDAEDVVQEAILRLWNAPSSGLEPTMPQMIRAIRWSAMDLGRRESRRQGRESRYRESVERLEGSYFETDFASRDRGQRVQEALAGLGQEQREVIVLRIWGGLSYVEIAAALDLSANTVASRYRYGLGNLRKRLGTVLS